MTKKARTYMTLGSGVGKVGLLLLLSHFNRVRLCVIPQIAAHQALPSLGFPRQEHWSGLPFPSPMQESENWRGSRVRLLAIPWTAAYQAPPSKGFPGKSTGVGCHCLLRDIYIYICASILFLILFPLRLLQSIEQSSLCSTVGPCWFSVLNIAV